MKVTHSDSKEDIKESSKTYLKSNMKSKRKCLTNGIAELIKVKTDTNAHTEFQAKQGKKPYNFYSSQISKRGCQSYTWKWEVSQKKLSECH